jgi:tRNA-specific 2-thiouridylase
VLGPEESLRRTSCDVGDLNLFDATLLNEPREVQVKVRYATPAAAATLLPVDSTRLRIQFHEPQRALSPGQSAVFYKQDQVLGGGIIQAL